VDLLARAASLSLLALLLLPLAPVQALLLQAQQPYPPSASTYVEFYSREHGLSPLGVAGQYLVGFRQARYISATEVVAVDLYSWREYLLGYADTLGVNTSRARFWKSESAFAAYDDRVVAVFRAQDLSMIGRLALDGVSGIGVRGDGVVVAWGGEYIAVSSPPGYVLPAFYTVWPAVYYSLPSYIPARDALRLSGYDTGAIESDLAKAATAQASAMNLTVTRVSASYSYEYLSSGTPSDARSKLGVAVVAAYQGDALYAAVNISASVRVVVTAEAVAPPTNTTDAPQAQPQVLLLNASAVFQASFGALLSFHGYRASVEELYAAVLSAASGDILVVVYEPFLQNPTGLPQVVVSPSAAEVLVVDKTGYRARAQYPGAGASAAYLVAGYALIVSPGNTTYVYRAGPPAALVTSFPGAPVDYGPHPQGLYIAYNSPSGSVEVGVLDRYSGRAGRVFYEAGGEPLVGASFSEDILAVATPRRASYATASPVEELRVYIVGPGGAPAAYASGNYSVSYKGLSYSSEFSGASFSVKAPRWSTVRVSGSAGYSTFEATVVLDQSKDYRVYVQRPAFGASAAVQVQPYESPFRQGLVFIRDSDLYRASIGQWDAVDAYAGLVAAVRGLGGTAASEVALFTAWGGQVARAVVPLVATGVLISPPYVLVAGSGGASVLDAASLRPVYTLYCLCDTFDIDPVGGYLTGWASSAFSVAVADLRRGFTTYIRAGGPVAAAPVVNGYVYVYTAGRLDVYRAGDQPSLVASYRWDGVFMGFRTDGLFKVVGYASGGEARADVVSAYNGLVTVPGGEPAAVRAAYYLPPRAATGGSAYALVAFKTPSGYRVAAVGVGSYTIATSSPSAIAVSLAGLYIAEVSAVPNATPVIVLRDLSGDARVSIEAGAGASVLAASDEALVYGSPAGVYVVPRPWAAGKYRLEVRVVGPGGEPIAANVSIRGTAFSEVVVGSRTLYFSHPVDLVVEAAAPHMVPASARATLSDESPSVSVVLALSPAAYRVVVHVVSGGAPVQGGRVDAYLGGRVVASSEVAGGAANFTLPYGNYTFTFRHDLYAEASAAALVDRDTEIQVETQRTSVVVAFRVVGEDGRPVPTASLEVSVAGSPPRALPLGPDATARLVAPIGANISAVARAPGYREAVLDTTASLELEASGAVLQLSRLRGILTVVLTAADGSPERATVVVRNANGTPVFTAPVEGAAQVPLDMGSYTVEGVTEDGRTASAAATISEQQPAATANLVFPPRPQPPLAASFPLLLVAVVGATAAALVYRRFFRRVRPRVEK